MTAFCGGSHRIGSEAHPFFFLLSCSYYADYSESQQYLSGTREYKVWLDGWNYGKRHPAFHM
jgi:hypothetical protein